MKENNFKEGIPDFSTLVSSLPNKKEIESLKQYAFNDFYTKSIVKGKEGEYNLNKDFIYENFQMNSKKREKDIRYTSLKGLYIFFEKDLEKQIPIYVGISGDILSRIKQHMTGKTHFSASLAYLIGINRYKEKEKTDWPKTRSEFWNDPDLYKTFIKDIQPKMRDSWKISILPQAENYTLYLKEIYLACELKTKWNSFATH
ncbi:hypothetical protein EHQ81_06680 [Leptospira selangorensis]|uniref:GIY-YIG domain-containing protein n=1 Tax=Leptospira selangorensis TaxID=2484982 RepID=A0A5F2BYV0_9LEPT|nr:hypothetical protein [Leptospira selangorensis]TGM16064.1 hypothetical protein EHQ81_06680 [Leptospira selangorensis]TGM17985.1 hypothetical protein EHQ82_13025 [Leptospira selangorensis]